MEEVILIVVHIIMVCFIQENVGILVGIINVVGIVHLIVVIII